MCNVVKKKERESEEGGNVTQGLYMWLTDIASEQAITVTVVATTNYP